MTKTLMIPHAEMVNYGCRNCVWRLHDQCPHNIQDGCVYSFNVDKNNEPTNGHPSEGVSTIKGYCPEFGDFILSLAERDDSISAVWEKFAIYQAKLQSMEDYTTYKQLEKKIVELENNLKDSDDKFELERLKDKYKIIPFSNKTSFGMKDILRQIKIGKTYCLLGSSGVGKTTLLNKLIGKDVLAVNTVREKNGKGKHTTNKRQLICLKNGGLFIDTPGMRELGNFDVEEGLSETYDDIYDYVNQCKFTNCTHINEKGCAVLEAVKGGLIDASSKITALTKKCKRRVR